MLILHDSAGGNGAAVELEVNVGLLLAVEHERDGAAVPLRRGIAPKTVARGDFGPRRGEVELERDRVDEKRRRAVVEPAPDRGADGARKHHSRIPRYFTSSSSTSKISVALGGITPPAPRSPYAIADGMINVRWPPTFMPITPSSQPRMTLPAPRENPNGTWRSRELSNLAPFLSGLESSYIHPV